MASLPEARLGVNLRAKPGNIDARAYAIDDIAAPIPGDAAKIIDYLAVEDSPRYQPTVKSTFCNIYACDFCYLSGAYLPRVWWTENAVTQLTAGKPVDVVYGKTVRELNANSLFSWLKEHGRDFGWLKISDLDQMQAHVNAGGVGVICAQRVDLSQPGHISVVVPETGAHKAYRADGRVVRPLQSQAGARNFRYDSGPTAWWRGLEYREHGFFVVVNV